MKKMLLFLYLLLAIEPVYSGAEIVNTSDCAGTGIKSEVNVDDLEITGKKISTELESKLSKQFIAGAQACGHLEALSFSERYESDGNVCGLTIEEYSMLQGYLSDDYGCLNRAAREPSAYGDNIADVRYLIEVLNKALLKLPPYHGFVARGVEFPQTIRDLHQKGKIVNYKSFTSTSTQFGFNGMDRLLIYSMTGRPVMGFSSYPEEEEILISTDKNFKILEHFFDNGTNYYIMIEVTPQMKANPSLMKQKEKEALSLYEINYVQGKLKKKPSETTSTDRWRCQQSSPLSSGQKKPIIQKHLPQFKPGFAEEQ